MSAWADADPASLWPAPDVSILQSGERPPPKLPLETFGSVWGEWIVKAADASACPVDYVAAPLLASASALIGNARWAAVTSEWVEPPHLWVGVVGNSGTGKSPGADPLMRKVLPEIERRMAIDFPDKLRDWQVAVDVTKAQEENWKTSLREALKKGAAPPPPLPARTVDLDQAPQLPRLRQYDVTIEKVALLLASAAPKGLLLVRDELAGWVVGMTAYNAAGREFWLEAFGGREKIVDRVKYLAPIKVPYLVVAVYGGTQPDKLALLMREFDDGLMARFLWTWPEPVKFRVGQAAPRIDFAIDAFDKLRELELQPGDPPAPIHIPVTPGGTAAIEEFGAETQRRQRWTNGLLCSAFGKARGQVLRLSLVLEHLWWTAAEGFTGPPSQISERAVLAAAALVDQYFIPMAERVYGDIALPAAERLTTVLARSIWRQAPIPEIVNARSIQRARLPGLREADKVRLAINGLIEANWLQPLAAPAGIGGRARTDYAVNPRLKRAKRDD